MLRGRHAHLLLQTRAAIAAAGAVNLDHAFEPVVRKLGAANSDCAAGDLQDVTRAGTHTAEIRWRESRDGLADILHARFCHAQRQGCYG